MLKMIRKSFNRFWGSSEPQRMNLSGGCHSTKITPRLHPSYTKKQLHVVIRNIFLKCLLCRFTYFTVRQNKKKVLGVLFLGLECFYAKCVGHNPTGAPSVVGMLDSKHSRKKKPLSSGKL